MNELCVLAISKGLWPAWTCCTRQSGQLEHPRVSPSPCAPQAQLASANLSLQTSNECDRAVGLLSLCSPSSSSSSDVDRRLNVSRGVCARTPVQQPYTCETDTEQNHLAGLGNRLVSGLEFRGDFEEQLP